MSTCPDNLSTTPCQVVRKRAKAAALSRIFKSAWGLDTSVLTKVQLQKQLVSRGCTIATRGTPGDFKLSNSKQILVDLLYTKLSVSPPHISVTAFVEDAKVRAQAEGDAAVLAMAGPRPTVEGNPPISSDSSEDSEDNMPLNDVRRKLRRERHAAKTQAVVVDNDDSDENATVNDFLTNAATPSPPPPTHVDQVDSSSSEDSDESSDNDESDEDEHGIVSVGDQFLYSDEEEGDKTLTVRRIVRGGIVYVEEDNDILCLSYVRKKVSERMTVGTSTHTRGSRRSSRTNRRINYGEDIN